MGKLKVILTCPETFTDEFVQNLEKRFELVLADCSISEHESMKILQDANVFIMGGNELITASVLESIPRELRFIFAGIEARTSFPDIWDSVSKRVYATGGGQDAVAATTLQQLVFFNSLRSQGRMSRARQIPTSRDAVLRDQTLLVVGAGAIGKKVMRSARCCFGEVIYAGGRGEKTELRESGFRYVPDFAKAFSLANAVSIHLELNPVTENSVNIDYLDNMPLGALLVNNARAGIIPVDDLNKFLLRRPDVHMICDEFYVNGQLFLEVVNRPTVNVYQSLIDKDNFWYTGHTANRSEQTKQEYSVAALGLLEKFEQAV